MPTVGQVVAVVDAQLGSGLLRCLGPGCGGRLARWGFGVERDLVGLGGGIGRVRPRRALCAGCGVSHGFVSRKAVKEWPELHRCLLHSCVPQRRPAMRSMPGSRS